MKKYVVIKNNAITLSNYNSSNSDELLFEILDETKLNNLKFQSDDFLDYLLRFDSLEAINLICKCEDIDFHIARIRFVRFVLIYKYCQLLITDEIDSQLKQLREMFHLIHEAGVIKDRAFSISTIFNMLNEEEIKGVFM